MIHVLNHGISKVDPKADLLETLLASDKTYTVLEAMDLLYQAYETTYGIYDHRTSTKEDVLAPVAYRDAEDLETHSVIREYARRYRRRKVKDVFGLSWNEFMALPKSQAMMILEESSLDAEESKQAFDDFLKTQQKGKVP